MQVRQSPQFVIHNTACPGFKPGGSAWAVEAIRACEEAMSLRNVNLVWPLASSEEKTLAFHPSRVCICPTSSKLMHQMVFMLKDLPTKH